MITKTESRFRTTVVDRAISVCIDNHGYPKVMPRIGPIDKPIENNGWRFNPRTLDDTIVPAEADRLVLALKKSGVLIKQEIIGHNLIEEQEKQEKMASYKATFKRRIEQLRGAVAIGAVLVAAFVQVVSTLVLGLASFVLAVDPILIVVLEDDTWLCVAEWDS